MIFTPNQINELLKVIEYHHIYFIAKNIGTSVLSSTDKVLLKSFGIDTSKFIEDKNNLSQAFKFGVLAQVLGDNNVKTLTFLDFKSYINAGKYIPLIKSEKNALAIIKNQAYNDIKKRSGVITSDLRQIHGDKSRELRFKYEKDVMSAAEKAIINREGVAGMVSELGHRTQDWARDFGKVSEYVMHTAYEEGRALKLEEDFGKDVLVYKDVYDGACRYCIGAYLTGGLGSEPKIFKLDALRANGDNIGRKAANWLPVLGPMHPYCRCTVNYSEPGQEWSDEQRRFIDKKEFVRKVERKSKIKIQVGTKNFEV